MAVAGIERQSRTAPFRDQVVDAQFDAGARPRHLVDRIGVIEPEAAAIDAKLLPHARLGLRRGQQEIAAAQRRLKWDEAMAVQLTLARRRQEAVQRPASFFHARLPVFVLTA